MNQISPAHESESKFQIHFRREVRLDGREVGLDGDAMVARRTRGGGSSVVGARLCEQEGQEKQERSVCMRDDRTRGG